MVTPLARLKADEFFGEMSFFDKSPRSADVIATTDTELQKISHNELIDSAPFWLRTMAKSMTEKLRDLNKVISQKGIKRQSTAVKPLSIDEQRRLYELLTQS
jgi:CRP-like cAMP-binding protein